MQLGEVSFRTLKMSWVNFGALGDVSFEILESGEASFGILTIEFDE